MYKQENNINVSEQKEYFLQCGSCKEFTGDWCQLHKQNKTAGQGCADYQLGNNEIRANKKPPKKKTTAGLKMNFGWLSDPIGAAESFLDEQPMHYDKNKIWWAWAHSEYRWRMIDETDIYNSIAGDPGPLPTVLTIASKTRNEILEAMRQRSRLRKPKDPEKSWVQFHDEIVDIKTGKRWPATPEYFFTCPLPHKLGKTADTPYIDELFKQWVVSDDQDISYCSTLKEILAYSMLTDQFLQRLFALTGSGSNGKGTFLKLLCKFLGRDNVTTTSMKALATNRFEASALYQKQAAVMGEVDAYDMSNTTLIKQLTGEDSIRYEFKGRDIFTADSFATCIIATNSLPVTPDKTDGFYRRWLIVDFPHQFSVGKDVIGAIPEHEWGNLALQCVQTAQGLYDSLRFTNEGNILDRKAKYEERSDPLAHFIENYCLEELNSDIRTLEFYKAFKEYLEKHKLRTITQRQVTKSLQRMGYTVGKKHSADHTTSYYAVFDLKLNIPGSSGSLGSFISPRAPMGNEQKEATHATQATQAPDFDTFLPCSHEGCKESPCAEHEGVLYCERHWPGGEQ